MCTLRMLLILGWKYLEELYLNKEVFGYYDKCILYLIKGHDVVVVAVVEFSATMDHS